MQSDRGIKKNGPPFQEIRIKVTGQVRDDHPAPAGLNLLSDYGLTEHLFSSVTQHIDQTIDMVRFDSQWWRECDDVAHRPDHHSALITAFLEVQPNRAVSGNRCIKLYSTHQTVVTYVDYFWRVFQTVQIGRASCRERVDKYVEY